MGAFIVIGAAAILGSGIAAAIALAGEAADRERLEREFG